MVFQLRCLPHGQEGQAHPYHQEGTPLQGGGQSRPRLRASDLGLLELTSEGPQVPMTLPRPDLADRLGVTYRLIPVLAIGKDVYCDSSLIASVLERTFTPAQEFGTLFPKRKGGAGTADTGMIKALAMSYADRALGALGSQTLPYHKFKPEFLADRSNVGAFNLFLRARMGCGIGPTNHRGIYAVVWGKG